MLTRPALFSSPRIGRRPSPGPMNTGFLGNVVCMDPGFGLRPPREREFSVTQGVWIPPIA